MHLELNDEEREELVRIVESYLADTRIEVRRASTSRFRDQLHHEKDLLDGVLEKLRAGESC